MDDSAAFPDPEQKDFLWIKKGLDPGAGYVIFEHDLNYQGQSIFDPSNRVYAFLKEKNLSWRQVKDTDLSMEYLVIRVSPGQEDHILGRVLGFGLPENTVFYIFKAEEV